MKKLSPQKLVALVKKGAWFVQGFNGLPLYLHCVASNTGWMTKKYFGANYSHFFLRVHESRAHWYYDELDMHAIGEGYYRRVKTVAQLWVLERKHKAAYVSARVQTSLISPTRLQQLSFKELTKTGEQMARELTMSVGLAHSHEGISFVSEPRLKNILDARNLNTPENYQLLSAPTRPSFLSEAQILLGKIKAAHGAYKLQLAKKFLKNFGWIDSSYVCGVTLSVEGVLKKARELKHVPSLQELKNTLRKKAKLIQSLRLTREELFTVRTVEICTKWQDTRKKFIMMSLGRFEPVVEELARRLNITPANFKYITPTELTFKNLSSKKFLDTLKNRWPGSAYYTYGDKRIAVYPGKDYTFIQKETSKTGAARITEIKGTIANKGIARGRVHICRTIHDIPKVKKGEILVAYMTRPEFMPAMQKAAAFVTNEGGITSHAAIISREMNKPCIIGTKIATEVLQDGDMVEVNANHGIVRKL